MISLRRLVAIALLSAVTACAGGPNGPIPYQPAVDGWIPAPTSTRSVGLGLPGGAVLARSVTFSGGLELIVDPASPLRSLSDFKLTGDGGFVTVSDAGDLARGRLTLNGSGRLTGLTGLAFRRLTLADGQPIQDKTYGDAEGLALLDDGRLLPGVRTFISLPAGIAQFPLPEFVILTILGTLPWTIFLVYVGSELGHNWTMILDYKLEIAAACAAISACIGLAYYIYHKRKSK